MAVAGEQILTRLGFEVDGISLKSSLEKAAAFGSALRRAFADASAAFVGVAKGEAEVAAQADALGVSVERFAEWRFIAEQTGASSDALGASLKAMLANNPGLSDAASELERAGGAMREMGDAQREAYARGLGIDPSLIPMLTRDVSGLRDMFRSLYATAGTDAAKAAEDGKGFLDGMARLAGLCDLLAKTVALSLLGTARSGIEALGDAFVAHFDDIRRVLELVVALASAAAPVIGAALGLLVSWGGQLAGLLGTLDADLVAGIGKGIAAFMALRGAVGAAIIGFANLKEAWALLTAAFSANPYLLAIGAAVTLAVVVMDNWGAVKAFLLGVWDAVASGARAAVDAVASAFNNAVNFVTGAGSAIAGAVGPAVSSAMGFAGAAVSGTADLLASAFGGAADVVSGLFSGMGAAIGIALQGIMDGFRLLGGLAAAIFSGDLSGALDAALGLFSGFRETAFAIFAALGEAVLGVFAFVWGQVTASFPDFGAWAASSASAVAGAFGKALGRCGRGGRYARIPRSVRPRRAGRPRRERRFRIWRPFLRERFLRECLGGGFRCGRFLRRRLGSGLCGRHAFGWRFRGRSCGRLGYGRFRGGQFWGGRPRRSILPGRFRRLLRGRSGKLRTGKGAGRRLLPCGPFRARLRDAAVLLPLHGSLPDGRPVAVGGDGLRRRRGFAGIQDGNQRQRRKLAG